MTVLIPIRRLTYSAEARVNAQHWRLVRTLGGATAALRPSPLPWRMRGNSGEYLLTHLVSET